MGTWEWIKSTASQVASTVSLVFTTVTKILFSPNVLTTLDNIWEGAIVFKNSFIFSSVAKKTRAVLSESAQLNLVFNLGLCLLYEAGVKRALRFGLGVENSTVEQRMDMLVAVGLAGLAARRFFDNIIMNHAVAKATTLEHRVNETPCAHPTDEKLKAKVAGPLFYMANVAAVNAVEYFIDPRAKYVLRPMLYGQYFLEQRANAVGMCTDDRYEFLAKNNAIAFGLGGSFLLSYYLSSKFIYEYTGAESWFINNALFAFLTQYFIILTLSMNKSLSSNSPGLDLSYPIRKAAIGSAKIAWGVVEPIWNAPGPGIDRLKLERALNYYPSRFLAWLLLGIGIKERESFFVRPIIKRWCELYLPTIESSLRDFEAWRHSWKITIGEYLIKHNVIQNIENYFGKGDILLSDSKKRGVLKVRDPKIDRLLNDVRSFLSNVESRQTVVYVDRRQMQEALDRANHIKRLGTQLADTAIPLKNKRSSLELPLQPVPNPSLKALEQLSLLAASSAEQPTMGIKHLSDPLPSEPLKVFDFAQKIFLIAYLPSWRKEAAWTLKEAPDGVLSIRSSTKKDLITFCDKIQESLQRKSKTRTPKTMAYYSMVQNLAMTTNHEKRLREVEKFCQNHLTQEERDQVDYEMNKPLTKTAAPRPR